MLTRQQYIRDLKEFISIPTVSSDTSKKNDVKRGAYWLARHISNIGLKVKVFDTALHPIVYAEWISDHSLPTILFYGHYDVQPAEDLSKWSIHPFRPVTKNNYIYGRGSSDDKGQLFIHLKAIEELLYQEKSLPVNIKFLLEGEEEIGSPSLSQFIHDNKKMLASDVAVMSDTNMLSVNQPAITYALRGMLNVEVSIKGENKELHSGSYGGIILNPINVLACIITKLHTIDNRIAVNNFYDDVININIDERNYLRRYAPDDDHLKAEASVSYNWGEKGYTEYERITSRPSLTVSSITGGYQGEGVKSMIPSAALAKLNFRLVPDQHPARIFQLVKKHFVKVLPREFKAVIKAVGQANPVLLNIHNPYIRAASAAYKKVFQVKPVYLRSGGSIPSVNMFNDLLHIPVVLMGFALPSDSKHAPNEKFYLPNLFRGILTSKAFIQNVASLHNDLSRNKKNQYITA